MAKEEVSIKHLQKQMEKVQDSKRFQHTLGVTFTAAALAMRYGVDLYEAQVAGMLHDCAKAMPYEEQLEICKKNKIEVTEVEKKNPALLHAKVGAFLAKEKYDIENEEILSAILYHTTGRPAMSLLEKIIYIADYIEPGRKMLPGMTLIREKAFVDLNEALYYCLKNIVDYLDSKNDSIDLLTQETYEYYAKERI